MTDPISKDDQRFEELLDLQSDAGVYPELDNYEKTESIEQKYEVNFLLEEMMGGRMSMKDLLSDDSGDDEGW